jgi:hypothetical protein
MPTVLRVGAYRFYFYSGDRDEPPHVHIERGGETAKFWLNPVRLERSKGFNSRELNELQSIVKENREQLLERWKEFFDED